MVPNHRSANIVVEQDIPLPFTVITKTNKKSSELTHTKTHKALRKIGGLYTGLILFLSSVNTVVYQVIHYYKTYLHSHT